MRYLLTTIFFVIATMMMAIGNNKFVLVIDAGHGGHDAGAVGAMSKEKNINLKTALAFGKYVEQNCPDVKVIYTRKTDVFIPLHQRADIANKNHADVFISIHTNSLPAGRVARGFETYTMGMRRSDEKLSAAQRENSVITYEQGYQERYAGYDPNSPESAIMFEFIHDKNMSKSVELAKLVQKETCSNAGCQDKGVKQDVFLVLRETSMPACLIELGFISTPDEENKLNTDAYIDKLAFGIYSAFLKYKEKNSPLASPVHANVQDAMPTAAETPKAEQPAKPAEEQKPKQSVHKRRPEIQQSSPEVAQPSVPQPKEENVVVDAPVTVEQPVAEQSITTLQVVSPTEVKPETPQANEGQPVFKVQFLTGTKVLHEGASQFKGLTGTSYYKDGGIVKFTVGNCNSFEDAVALKKTIADKFPDAFVVAFINGVRVDLNTARNYKK